MRGLIRVGGTGAFVIAPGAPLGWLAERRRRTNYAAIMGLAAFVLAVLATIYA